MPNGEPFTNPYRWVHVDNDPTFEPPSYHHRFSGSRGRLTCRLTALTPMIVSTNNNSEKRFVHHGDGSIFVPGTSLKGTIRSVFEMITGSTAGVHKGRRIDDAHRPDNASHGQGQARTLDAASRVFGTLKNGAYAGHVQFSDADVISTGPRSESVRVLVGSPRPNHRAFYSDNHGRKLYHHCPGAKSLREAPDGVGRNQSPSYFPASTGTIFEFTVDFNNLDPVLLGQLVYAIVLEEDVTVVLSTDALPCDVPAHRLTGPMRHKIGGAKASGGGSSQIKITSASLCESVVDRYRKGVFSTKSLTGVDLDTWIREQTSPTRQRNDRTLLDLRAMMIYDDNDNDPRRSQQYPEKSWFNENSSVPLRPTH